MSSLWGQKEGLMIWLIEVATPHIAADKKYPNILVNIGMNIFIVQVWLLDYTITL